MRSGAVHLSVARDSSPAISQPDEALRNQARQKTTPTMISEVMVGSGAMEGASARR